MSNQQQPGPEELRSQAQPAPQPPSGGRVNIGPIVAQPFQPPSPLLEFAALALLLGVKQEITLGTAITPDLTPDTSGGNLVHFQRFQEAGNPFANTVEMHSDGTIYVAYTPSLGPVWYDTFEANENDASKNNPISAGSTGSRPFIELKAANLNETNWVPSAQAFPPGRGPAPRWAKFSPPAGIRPGNWLDFFRSGPVEQIRRVIREATPPLPTTGAYCFRDTWSPVNIGGPPEWQTILPINNSGKENGQRKLDPDNPVSASGNHFITWDELVELMQSDPARALNILAWRNHPNSDDFNDDTRRIPWLSSTVEGIVTNSFLSGSDVAFTHREVPSGYWVGNPEPKYREDCGTFEANNALCDDWEVFIRPDPEYHFLLAREDIETVPILQLEGTGWVVTLHERQQGNFDADLTGNLENEIEQWLMPGGYRPEPGDRIHMAGRWIIDCGHDNWHAELHPYELVVSSHTETGHRPQAIGNIEVVTAVVVTGAWSGGTLEFDIWPPARPNSIAVLDWAQEQEVMQELSVQESLEPGDNPNHLHVRIVSTAPWDPLLTKGSNDVFYNSTRRLVTRYHLWWREPRPDELIRVPVGPIRE